MTITIVGLGPGSAGDLTLEAHRVLAEAPEIWLRTRIHPVVASLPSSAVLRDFDSFYDNARDFAEVYERICAELMHIASGRDVVYAVPGHPLVGEATVRRLLAESRSGGPPVRIVAGLSFLEPVCTALGIDPLEAGLQIVDALSPHLEPDRPALCAQVYARHVASGLKLVLLDLYPPEHAVTVVTAAGVEDAQLIWTGPLAELDRGDRFDHLSSVYLPALQPELNRRTFAGLRGILHRLYAPGGCPWDREQTHTSLRPYLLEETYEALEALDSNDPHALAEELGDLLLQVGLHCEIAAEAGEFDYGDVFEGITSKLIRRHPHVFGDVTVRNAEDVAANWQVIKQAERSAAEEPARSILAGVPKSMPALAFGKSVQSRAAQIGFDWREMDGVVDKLGEEVAELRRAASPEEREEEFGDILFTLVNVARWLGISPEEALRRANQKFVRRFGAVEALARERNMNMKEAGLDALDALWNEVKATEG